MSVPAGGMTDRADVNELADQVEAAACDQPVVSVIFDDTRESGNGLHLRLNVGWCNADFWIFDFLQVNIAAMGGSALVRPAHLAEVSDPAVPALILVEIGNCPMLVRV